MQTTLLLLSLIGGLYYPGIMVAARQFALNDEDMQMNAPRFITLVISIRVIYIIYNLGGAWLGLISAILTSICVAPLFNFSLAEDTTTRALQDTQTQAEDSNRSSQIYTEASTQELQDMRHEDHSSFGRFVHQAIENWSQDIEELIYIARVLRENNGLLILLIGGVSSMMMALVAGLDDVHVMRALLLSITCYGITTILVARSARRIVNQHIAQHEGQTLSTKDVRKILDAVPEESFVLDDDLEICDVQCLENMIYRRDSTYTYQAESHSECTHEELELKKKNLIVQLRKKRNYNESCCICMSPFVSGERIRVLPNCHHEFHQGCIDKWANTFAANGMWSNCNSKQGKPTCPLDKTCIGEHK